MKVLKVMGYLHFSQLGYRWLINKRNWKFGIVGHEDEDKYPIVYYKEDSEYFFTDFYDTNQIRSNKDVIDCLELYGSEALDKDFNEFKIVEIPDDVKWNIYTPDMGWEYVAEVHRVW